MTSTDTKMTSNAWGPDGKVESTAAGNSPDQPVGTLSVDERMQKKGIPKAQVLEDVEKYLRENKLTIDEANDQVKENFRRYKIVESNFSQQKAKIEENLLDYKKSLAALDMLQEQKEKGKSSVDITYKLDENIYSRAVIDSFDKVCVWLGANVMVEYTLDEAQKLLKSNLSNIQRLNNEVDEELDFLRDQINTSEVNVAHLYNHNVQKKRREMETTQKQSSR